MTKNNCLPQKIVLRRLHI